MRRIMVTAALALSIALSASSCVTVTEPPALDADTTIIDVRTPEEFASRHLEGAVNIDVQAADFEARIAELDAAGTYVVYCRSGNRSGHAIDRMRALGFTDLTNGGSVESASHSTGIALVSGP